VHYFYCNSLLYLSYVQELTTGAPLSISTAEVISGRVAEVEAPVGVCPFPHGMTAASASAMHASEEAIDIPAPVWEDEEEESSPLVQLLDGLDDTADGAVDYMALADEVERWLAEEERQRNL
jgi:hypothetical protein